MAKAQDDALRKEQEAHAATNEKLEEALKQIEELAGQVAELQGELTKEKAAHEVTTGQLEMARAMSEPVLLEAEEPQVDAELLLAGLTAYGIEREHLAGAGMDPATGQVVLVTVGGSKVRWPLAEGQTPAHLSLVQITGQASRPKRPAVAGKER